MVTPGLAFSRLRHVPLQDILAANDVLLVRRGTRLVGPCPVHGGDNPRAFVVNPDRNLWHCFTRCQRGGDAIDLVRALHRCDYRQAARRLAALAGSAMISSCGAPVLPSVRSSQSFRPYTRSLRLDPYAGLLRCKGIRPETARRFEVGAYLLPRGFLAGCVGVRLHDPHGRPLGYAGRRLEPRAAHTYGKWKLPPQLPKGRIFYNLHRVSPHLSSQGVVLVEGPWAVLRLAQLRIPAVALLGVHLTRHQAHLLEPARHVTLLLDGDAAGRLAAPRIAHQLRPHVVLHPSDGLDPDDLSDQALLQLLRPLSSL